MKNITSIPITFNIQDEVSNNDTRFINCTIDVLHTGTNFNGSVFTKEVVERNLETIKNTPVLGFIREMPDGEYDFKGHEYIITKDENGVRRKNIGSVYGVIPESCNPRWYSKILNSGEEVEMLQVDALLWSKLEDSVDIMMRDIEKGQSMELCPDSIEGYEDKETGLFHFTQFSFDGCTILGTGIDPAMQDANITINEVQFTMSDFVKNIQSELNDKYKTFTELKVVNEKTNGGVGIMDNTDFTQTLLEQFSDISLLVSQKETFTDRFGYECPRYYTVDVQENEVIVVDAMNNYNYFGISFANEGDKPVLDFESAKRKKLRYEDYEDSSAIEGAFDFGKHISEIENTAFGKIEEANARTSEVEGKISEYETKVSEFEAAKNEIEEKYNQISAEFEEMKPKYEDYVKAERARLETELEAQKDAEFAKYEGFFKDDANFTELREKKAEKSLKEIESELAIMFARKSLANPNFSKSNDGAMVAGVVDNSEKDGFAYYDRYGYVPVK